MAAPNPFLQYQQQAVRSASPEVLILKLYDLAVGACRRGDRARLRAAVKELISALNMEKGGELAARLYNLYAWCMDESVAGDLEPVGDVLDGLRSAWKESVLLPRAA